MGGGRGNLGLSKEVWEHLSRPAACLVLNPLTMLETPPAQTSLLRSISSSYLGGKCATPLVGGSRCFLQPIPWVRATSIWVRSSPSSWAVLRDVYKEEGPELPKGGRAGSYPVNQHKCKPGRSFWPDLLVTFAVVRPSGSRSLLAGAGSVFPCTHNKGTPASSSPAFTLVFSGRGCF